MLSRFFIQRPIFSTVLSIVIVVVGFVSMNALPIAEYPAISPPSTDTSAVHSNTHA